MFTYVHKLAFSSDQTSYLQNVIVINMVHWMFNVMLSVVNAHVKTTSWDNDVIYVKRINIEMVSNVQVWWFEGEKFSILIDLYLACPPCYREVQKRVDRYRNDLRTLHNAILTLNSSQTLNSLREDKRLTSELDALAINLNNLKTDLNRMDLSVSFSFDFFAWFL